MNPDQPYSSFWDRTLGRQVAYFEGLETGRAENRDIQSRSLLVSYVGESPDGGSDARRAVRFATALTRLYGLVYRQAPDSLSVEAALHALGIVHVARRPGVLSFTAPADETGAAP